MEGGRIEIKVTIIKWKCKKACNKIIPQSSFIHMARIWYVGFSYWNGK